MKKLCYLGSFILFGLIIGLVSLNSSQGVNFLYYYSSPPVQMQLALLIFFFSMTAALATIFLCYPTIVSLTKELNKKARTAEKADISSEESSDKVKMLQAKIDTLEAALKDALAQKV